MLLNRISASARDNYSFGFGPQPAEDILGSYSPARVLSGTGTRARQLEKEIVQKHKLLLNRISARAREK